MNFSLKNAGAATMALLVSLFLASNVMAGKHVSRTLDDLTWVNGAPGIDFALVWGDWGKDDYGMIVKIKAGQAAPKHSHTSDYHGVTIQGNWVHTFSKSDDRILPPGSYTFQSGKENHGDRCAGPQDCLILIHQHGPRDFIVSKK